MVVCLHQPQVNLLGTQVQAQSATLFSSLELMSERKQHVQTLRKGARERGIQQVPDNAARDRVRVMALAVLEADLSDNVPSIQATHVEVRLETSKIQGPPIRFA